MGAEYTIWLARPDGWRLQPLDPSAWHSLHYRRPVNAVGALTLTLSAAFPVDMIALDSRIEVWRRPAATGPLALDTETIYFVRGITKRVDMRGERTYEINAVSAVELLARRIVAYAAASAQASKSGMAADTMIREIVLENLGSSATDTARSIATSLAVAAAAGTGPSVTKAFARRNVLRVCQEIAQAAADLGTPVYFDIVAPMPNTLEFRTYVGVRGSDHSYPSGINPVRLSTNAGTLTDVTRSYDYSDEATYVYAAGKGQESAREIATASSTTRMAASPFNRRELLIENSNATGTALVDEARAGLYAHRPRRIFRGTIVNAPGAIYGQHWGLGDKVSAELDGEVIPCRIDMVDVRVEDSEETIKADLRAEE